MPAAAFANFAVYGPGAASMHVTDAAGRLEAAQPVMTKRFGASIGGTGTAVTLRPYRGRAFALVNGGTGAVAAQPRKRSRFALSVSIGGALTQDGVTGAVLESKVEGDLTLKQAIRILLAQAAGNATGLDGATPEFRSAVDNGKVRIAGTYTGGTRTVTTLDGS